MRFLLLILGLLPYAGCVTVDAWMHEKARRVPRFEQWLHLGIGISIVAFVLFAFLGNVSVALIALAGALGFMAADEFGFHAGLSRQERRVHGFGAIALLLFVLVWLWTEYLL